MKNFINIIFILLFILSGCSYLPDKLVEETEKSNPFFNMKVELINRNKVAIKLLTTNLQGDYEIKIYRTEDTNSNPQEIGNFQKEHTVYVDTTVSGGKTYYYRLKVVNYKVQVEEKDKTYITEYKPVYILTENEFNIAFLPRNVILSNDIYDYIPISWEKVSNAIKYKIYRKDPSGIYFSFKYETTNNYIVDNVTSDGIYDYYINVINIYGEEVSNNNIYTGYKFRKSTFVVTNFDASKGADSFKIILTWDPLPDASDYLIFRKSPNESSYSKIDEITTNYYEDITLNCETNWYYVIPRRKISGLEGSFIEGKHGYSHEEVIVYKANGNIYKWVSNGSDIQINYNNIVFHKFEKIPPADYYFNQISEYSNNFIYYAVKRDLPIIHQFTKYIPGENNDIQYHISDQGYSTFEGFDHPPTKILKLSNFVCYKSFFDNKWYIKNEGYNDDIIINDNNSKPIPGLDQVIGLNEELYSDGEYLYYSYDNNTKLVRINPGNNDDLWLISQGAGGFNFIPKKIVAAGKKKVFYYANAGGPNDKWFLKTPTGDIDLAMGFYNAGYDYQPEEIFHNW